MMELWEGQNNMLPPIVGDYPLESVKKAYLQLLHVRSDLDRARLVVDRVRRREKLKRDIVRTTGEQLVSMGWACEEVFLFFSFVVLYCFIAISLYSDRLGSTLPLLTLISYILYLTLTFNIPLPPLPLHTQPRESQDAYLKELSEDPAIIATMGSSTSSSSSSGSLLSPPLENGGQGLIDPDSEASFIGAVRSSARFVSRSFTNLFSAGSEDGAFTGKGGKGGGKGSHGSSNSSSSSSSSDVQPSGVPSYSSVHRSFDPDNDDAECR
jgi:hypothetical protein